MTFDWHRGWERESERGGRGRDGEGTVREGGDRGRRGIVGEGGRGRGGDRGRDVIHERGER